MAEHLEIELKWALDLAGHAILTRELERVLGAPRVLEQDNRFFDTPDRRLRRAALNLRLRRENDRLLMTCKGRGGIGAAGEHRHTEWEEWLDPSRWAAVERGILSADDLPLPEPVRQALSGGRLEALGGFANRRLEFHQHHEPVALLCLDRTDFLGKRIDHELEIETAAPQVIADLWRRHLDNWGVHFTSQPITKFARFLTLSGG
jgi:uncharacterized protein YjbK